MRFSLAALALVAFLPSLAFAEANTCGAPQAPLFPDGVKIVRLVRVFTGPDGESHFQDTALTGTQHALFNSGKTVTQTMLAEGIKVALIAGPANIDLPMHPQPKTTFLELAGSSTVTVASGDKREITPGIMVEFDDPTSKTGHGGRTGPCGYVALSMGTGGGPAMKPAP